MNALIPDAAVVGFIAGNLFAGGLILISWWWNQRRNKK